ncbi:hypothetical protein ACQ4PT_026192 [Festuca glaucescens]
MARQLRFSPKSEFSCCLFSHWLWYRCGLGLVVAIAWFDALETKGESELGRWRDGDEDDGLADIMRSRSSCFNLSDKNSMLVQDDYVCAFFDDGGSLIWCEGECGRLFHPAKPDGVHSKCETLGLSKEQVETSVFVCKNCEYKKHQCVVCGGLGSSDTSSDFKFVEWYCLEEMDDDWWPDVVLLQGS